jgi:hypothetical protein
MPHGQALGGNAQMLGVLARDDKNSEPGKRAAALIQKWGDDASRWQESARKWKGDAAEIKREGDRLGEAIKKYEGEAKMYHHRADFLDLGELGVELALVLCSIAVLTRGRAFWYSGIVVGAVGVAVAAGGFFVRGHAHDHPEKSEKHEESRRAPALPDGGRLAGPGAAPAGGQEAVDAQPDERGAEQRHQRGADAGDPLHLAPGNQGGGGAPPRGQQAEHA